jgi:Uma2 family endonuclease
MDMQAHAPRFITEDEYWEMLENSPVKYEYFDGSIYAMAGASYRHNILAANALSLLVSRLRGKPCRAVGSDQHVKIEETGLQTFPDIVVVCPNARFEPRRKDTLLEPTVLIEVLSPGTADYDRTDKFDHYKQIPTLQDYVLIAQDKMRIEHYHRAASGDWILKVVHEPDETIALEAIGCTLSVADVYDGVELPARVLPLREQIDFGE